MKKKYIKLIEFVTEQNRLIRTCGLPKEHPNGKLEPCDVVLSPEEKRFWEIQEQLYKQTINELYKY